MIHWSNGEKVKAKIIGIRDYENIILTLNKQSSNSEQVELIDKTGTLYYVNKNSMRVIVPKDLKPESMKDIMIIEPDDMYMEPQKKVDISKMIYKPKKYKTDRAKKKALKKK